MKPIRKRNLTCECGCGRTFPSNRSRTITINKSRPDKPHIVTPAKHYIVHHECEKPFSEELGITFAMTRLVNEYVTKGFFARLSKARDLARMQHAVNIRRKGMKATKKIAIRSSIMFVAPMWLGKILEKVWRQLDGANKPTRNNP